MARDILLTALDEPRRADLSWIEQLIETGNDFGGVELEIPPREPAARVVDFSEPEFDVHP